MHHHGLSEEDWEYADYWRDSRVDRIAKREAEHVAKAEAVDAKPAKAEAGAEAVDAKPGEAEAIAAGA